MAELDDLLEERAALTDERDRARDRVAELERQNAELGRSLDQARVATAEATARIASGERTVARLEAELATARKRVQTLELESAAATAAGKAAVDRLAELEPMFEAQQARIRELEKL